MSNIMSLTQPSYVSPPEQDHHCSKWQTEGSDPMTSNGMMQDIWKTVGRVGLHMKLRQEDNYTSLGGVMIRKHLHLSNKPICVMLWESIFPSLLSYLHIFHTYIKLILALDKDNLSKYNIQILNDDSFIKKKTYPNLPSPLRKNHSLINLIERTACNRLWQLSKSPSHRCGGILAHSFRRIEPHWRGFQRKRAVWGHAKSSQLD